MLVYLRAAEAGGATGFPAGSGLVVEPKDGRGVFFHNCIDDTPEAAAAAAAPSDEGQRVRVQITRYARNNM